MKKKMTHLKIFLGSFFFQSLFSAGRISSTSVPGGNQVDGLPPASSNGSEEVEASCMGAQIYEI